jgi:magnesium and cobalt transporter
LSACDIMVPRMQMDVVEASDPVETVVAFAIRTAHSRFPVVDGGRDNVIGILHAKDLLSLWSGRAGSVRELLRPPVFIPETKRLNVLLRDFRQNRHHLAIVVDEYGGVAGLITIEDVLEQIVGDIADEHDDPESEQIQQIDARAFSVKAVTSVEEFNERFGTQFPTADFDTIGGVVLAEFGRVPERDEEVVLDGFSFRVLSADGRRIRLLQVTAPRDIA